MVYADSIDRLEIVTVNGMARQTKTLNKIFNLSVLLSSFFTLPAGCTAFCFSSDFFRRKLNQSVTDGPEIDRPEVDLFLLKYISILMTGFFTAAYVLSGKTFKTWKLFFKKTFAAKNIESKKEFTLETMDRMEFK